MKKLSKIMLTPVSKHWNKLANKFKNDMHGVAAIEMAFIFPLMVGMFIGLIDLSNGLSASRKVTITANTVGDLVTQEPGATSTAAIDGIFTAALETMKPFNSNKVKLEVFNFRPDADGNPELNWSHAKTLGAGSGGDPSCGATPAITADMANLMTQNNDLIIARACYSFDYMLGKIFNFDNMLGDTGALDGYSTSFTMKEEMTLRPRRALQLDCDTCTQH